MNHIVFQIIGLLFISFQTNAQDFKFEWNVWPSLGENYIRSIDFFHAAEHSSHLSEAIHGKSSAKGKKWHTKFRDVIKHDTNGIFKLIRSAENHIKKIRSIKTEEKRQQNTSAISGNIKSI